MPLPRLRQLVLAAPQVEPVSRELARLLGRRPPYEDPGVGQFGLVNAVHTTGDAFVEVIAPTGPGTAVGRWLDRHGGGGYMAMLEVAEADTARARLAGLGVRIVWETAHPGVVDLHLHPKDVGGALVALDAVDPPGSWPWGGPGWQRADAGGLTALTVAAPDPTGTCRRWAQVLGVAEPPGKVLELDGGAQVVRFVPGDGGIVAAALAVPDPPVTTAFVAGVALTLEAL